MKKQSGARISQCMIVKNEEEHIAGALSWGAGIVSEQIVVDTGSTDRTAEIARRMGAKVFRFEWTNIFCGKTRRSFRRMSASFRVLPATGFRPRG